jgi:hypothetical protein
MGFLNRDKDVKQASEGANTAATLFGGLDSFTKVVQHSNAMKAGMSSAQAAQSATGLPGSKPLGHVGGALSALGLANDVHDMTQNGLNVNNGLSATSNALGLGSWAAGTFGAAGGTAATTAAPLMAAGAAGLTLGTAGNEYAKELGWAGKGSDGKNRSWSDMAGDWGAAGYEKGGHWLGIPALAGGILVGGAGAAVTGTMAAGRAVGRGAKSVGRGIKRGVGALLSW